VRWQVVAAHVAPVLPRCSGASACEEFVMRKGLFVCAALLLGLFGRSARAEERMVVTVPFEFVVKGEVLPAGRYEVVEGAGGNDRSVVLVRQDHGKAVALTLSTPADGRDPKGSQPALVFSRIENRYVLSQVWEGEDDGRQLLR
jgi:hypothetical protein